MARGIGAMALAAATIGVVPAAADGAQLSFGFGFGARRPGVATTAHVNVRFPRDADGRPRQLTKLDFRFPTGTRIDRRVAPTCMASDAQIDQRGPAACPAATQVGWGLAHADTGLGPPIDPVAVDAHTFNTPGGTVNVFTPHGSPEPAMWRTRQRYRGPWVRDAFPPPAPGFPPPNGRSLPTDATFTLDRRAGDRSWLTTPPRCPPRRFWVARIAVGYADGGADAAIALVPCVR